MRWKKLYFLIYFKLGKFIENIFKNQILGQKSLKKKKKTFNNQQTEFSSIEPNIFIHKKKNKLYFREIKFERKPKHCLIQKKSISVSIFQTNKSNKKTNKKEENSI